MWVNYQSDFYWWILQLLWSKSRSRFEEIFEEFLRPSHLRDELLMLLGFLSFEGFPVKNIVSMCADVINVFLLHCWSIYVYLQFFKVYANAENSTRFTQRNFSWAYLCDLPQLWLRPQLGSATCLCVSSYGWVSAYEFASRSLISVAPMCLFLPMVICMILWLSC